MEKQMDIEYTELDNSYNTLAKALANLIKQHTKTQKKIQEIKQQLEIIYNRLEIYIKNEFYDTYCYKKCKLRKIYGFPINYELTYIYIIK